MKVLHLLIAVCGLFLMVSLVPTLPAAETFAVPYSEALDLSGGDRTFLCDGLEVAVAVSRPARAFKPLRFKLTFKKPADPRVLVPTDVTLCFNMKMDMGDYRFSLQPKNAAFLCEAVLPRCLSGGSRWFGKLNFRVDGKFHQMVFILDLQ